MTRTAEDDALNALQAEGARIAALLGKPVCPACGEPSFVTTRTGTCRHQPDEGLVEYHCGPCDHTWWPEHG